MTKFLLFLLFFLLGSAVTLLVMTKYQSRPVEKAEEKSNAPVVDWAKIQKEVLPNQGYVLPVNYGDLGPKLVKAGVIDLTKFETNFASAGGLTDEEKEILSGKGDNPIRIDGKNATFVVDFFWALGLSNRNAILQKGPMAKDATPIDQFASTAGWTLGKKSGVTYYSKYSILSLTEDQQKVVEEVTGNVYRPCCGNSAAFPDCNHGMAILGLTEVLASQGYTADQIYPMLLKFQVYWFPQTYLDLASYWQIKGQSWSSLSAKMLLGSDFSSGQGFSRIQADLTTLLGVNSTRPWNKGGGGCGV